jgi:putative hemolysin
MGLNAILSAVEMAFVTVARPRLRQLAKEGLKDAARVLTLRERPERTLSVLQIGITLVGSVAAAVGGANAEEGLKPYFVLKYGMNVHTAELVAILCVVLPITYLNVVVCELVPKAMALQQSLGIMLRAAKWLLLFEKILSPLVNILERSTKAILHLMALRLSRESEGAPEETVELDSLSVQARQYVVNLVNIESKKIRDIYLPWSKVNFVNVGQTMKEVEAVAVSSGHTRLPVVKDDALIGVLNTKEFIVLESAGETQWEKIIRPMVKVLESDPLLKVLRIMQEKRSHLATVYSQNRRIGIVTMEDILEEVIGDVFDEDDDGALRRVLATAATFKNLSPKAQR